MKKLLIVFLAFGTLSHFACTKETLTTENPPPAETVTQIMVRFQNATTTDIEAARMEFDANNITNVGTIPADATTDYVVFDYFQIGYYSGGSFFPMGNLKGTMNGADFSAWSLNWCGTGVELKQLDPGKYTIKIVPVGNNSQWPYQIYFE